MLLGIPSKTHEPAKQLAHLIDHSEIPVGIRDDIDAGKMGYKLARQGGVHLERYRPADIPTSHRKESVSPYP